jgi:hypothetical protein
MLLIVSFVAVAIVLYCGRRWIAAAIISFDPNGTSDWNPPPQDSPDEGPKIDRQATPRRKRDVLPWLPFWLAVSFVLALAAGLL